jgi:hypothetical protein
MPPAMMFSISELFAEPDVEATNPEKNYCDANINQIFHVVSLVLLFLFMAEHFDTANKAGGN